jgi:uncharacterized protein YqhQ
VNVYHGAGSASGYAARMDDREKLRLGGMALQNGILVHGPTHWAVAVRRDDGGLEIGSGRKPRLPEAIVQTPMLRGVARVAEAMALLPIVRTRVPHARLPMEDATTGAAVAGATALAAALRRTSLLPPLLAESLAAGVGLVPALVAVRGSQVAGYHGAEHKAIGGYEQGEDAVDATKEHDRCGSHLIGPMLVASTVGNVLARRLPRQRQGAGRLAASIAAVGLAVETFAWMGRNGRHPLARALRRPGHELQRVAATREPSAAELAVADAALAELLRLERT